MGLGGISLAQLVILFAVVILVFGTKKIRNLGEDLGSAVKGFRKAMDDDSTVNTNKNLESNKSADV